MTVHWIQVKPELCLLWSDNNWTEYLETGICFTYFNDERGEQLIKKFDWITIISIRQLVDKFVIDFVSLTLTAIPFEDHCPHYIERMFISSSGVGAYLTQYLCISLGIEVHFHLSDGITKLNDYSCYPSFVFHYSFSSYI